MHRPFRFWMTGCFAVAMAAFGGGRSAMAGEAAEPGDAVEIRTSRYSAAETLQRLEKSAARHGFSVFARVDPRAARHGEPDGYAVLVFESTSGGGTPVLMDAPGAAPDLPLSVHVRAVAAGLSEVWVGSARGAELPPEVARDLTELPALVADALG